MLTSTQKKYLLCIAEIENNKGIVRSVDISRAIGVSRASVSKMVSNLTDVGYIEKDSYSAVELTDSGRQVAENLYELYKRLYLFLVKKLNSHKQTARADAMACISSLSDENTQKFRDVCLKQSFQKEVL